VVRAADTQVWRELADTRRVPDEEAQPDCPEDHRGRGQHRSDTLGREVDSASAAQPQGLHSGERGSEAADQDEGRDEERL
jgi:hypothetical protein